MEMKVNIAKQSGITLTMLEPTDIDESADERDSKSNFNPTIGAVQGRNPSWFGPEDKFDLNSEFQSMMDGKEDGEGATTNGKSTQSKTDATNENLDGPTFVDGKLRVREQLMGISVGSAGGWSLEVFPGDFVVHRKYGIGKYERTVLQSKKKLTPEEKEMAETRRKEIINELMKEGKQLDEIQAVVSTFGTEVDKDPISNPMTTVLEISYSDAVVHVPIERAYRLSRYRAGDAAIKPRLSRVKGEAWSKAKRKVEANTVQMAEDVLALYATRETLNRSPFDPSLEGKVKTFATSFPFEPTPDQKKCFEDVENDMVWRSRPMDRLICGDVGFGKTEVAMRALFRAVANGRQAALLAPTGVLAAQHFKQIVRRMGEDTEHNFNIALLRGGMGKNTKKGRELRAAIAAGEVNIVVGTHALLSNGMSFNDLGLLTIDEEQRFGVNQKERLKLICNCVDVLTLSATPIPRTLQMSLSGIRDTSTIRSPPPMRKPTISYVQEFEESLIKDAIERELAREGQCFYVVPRISQLDDAAEMLKRISPSLRVIQAHGRMPRGTAEDNVAAFAEGNYDVLLATTVIENGVDIPRVNTIIIQNAQAFGMSTLYQLRGRVGRSDLQAYAYFFHKNDAITEQSAQRLQAMADLHELGSGFDVANRDLEIRGAGSLLGTEQSGMAAKVGFDLYMRMLKKSIRQLRGLDLPVVPRSNVLLPNNEGSIEWDEVKEGDISSYLIPESYIEDAKERSQEEGIARLAESTQQLVEVTGAWRKKYGALPAELQVSDSAARLIVPFYSLTHDSPSFVPLTEQLEGIASSRMFTSTGD
jgi:transcription-repair coupling factor (superfamily II helicase)